MQRLELLLAKGLHKHLQVDYLKTIKILSIKNLKKQVLQGSIFLEKSFFMKVNKLKGKKSFKPLGIFYLEK
jgi:hypothetical protein